MVPLKRLFFFSSPLIQNPDSEIDLRLLIHQSLAGCVIGKGGGKIKEIRDVSTFYSCFGVGRSCSILSTDASTSIPKWCVTNMLLEPVVHFLIRSKQKNRLCLLLALTPRVHATECGSDRESGGRIAD